MNKLLVLFVLLIFDANCETKKPKTSFSYLPGETVEIYYPNTSAWGPDGNIYFIKQIIFEHSVASLLSSRNGTYLCTMNNHGENKKELRKILIDMPYYFSRNTHDQFLSISIETGDIVLGLRGDNDGLYLSNINSQEDFEQITNEGAKPTINRNGTHIVFERGFLNYSKIWIYNLKQKTFKCLSLRRGEMDPSFTLDGKSIIYRKVYPKNKNWMKSSEVWKMDSNGENRTLLLNSDKKSNKKVRYPYVSQFHDKVYYFTDEICIFDLNTKKIEYTLKKSTSYWIRISPDGKSYLIHGVIKSFYSDKKMGVEGFKSRLVEDCLSRIESGVLW